MAAPLDAPENIPDIIVSPGLVYHMAFVKVADKAINTRLVFLSLEVGQIFVNKLMPGVCEGIFEF
jgi:hypothetical protein